MGEACLGGIFKARCDKREYQSLLLSNGIRVLLISDPETDKAAASMDVKVGSFSDPEELLGLAHFLEHMLFYASEKYPEEDEFIKFVTASGGFANAYTASENTNFHFEVNHDRFSEALERFSQFFICPLMSEDATSREMNAVDSECALGRSSDTWRLYQLWGTMSSSRHPFHKFGIGNLQTLNPKDTDVDTRKEMINFYKKHYSANVMCLAVLGKESMDELQKLVEDNFSTVKNNDLKPPYFPGEPCEAEHLQIFVTAVPLKDRHSLQLQWPITSAYQHYKAHPSYYISDLVGHEAEGSIFALLKSIGWATGLAAWGDTENFEYAFFNIKIELTDSGTEHTNEIITIIFSYIKLLRERGVTQHHFEEVKRLSEMGFHFQDKYAPGDYVSWLASQLHIFPVEDWLVGTALPREFNPELIQQELDLLTPERVRILFSSKKFEGKTTMVEPWFGAEYSVERISDQLINDWRNTPLDERLHLPLENTFIPSDLSVQCANGEKSHPRVVKNSPGLKLWFKPDHAFKMPKGYFVVNMHCPEAHCSLEAATLSNLFARLLLDSLKEFGYYAKIAGLYYSVSIFISGFQIFVGGYSQKLGHLFKSILSRMMDFQLKQDRFTFIKEKYIRDFQNYCLDNTGSQASYYCGLLLRHGQYHKNDHLEVVSSLDLENLKRFISNVFSVMSAECYVAGNFTETHGNELAEIFQQAISKVILRPVPPSSVRDRRVVNLEAGSDFYYPAVAMNPEDENSSLLNYYQIGRGDTRLDVLGDLLVAMGWEAAFKQLRSVEQLGYSVSLSLQNDWGVKAIRITIQSKVKDPIVLDQRTEAFLEQFETQLNELTDEVFKKYVDGVIGDKLEKHKNLWEESSFYWSEIENNTLQFERPQTEVDALRGLTNSDLTTFFDDYIKLGGRHRRKLSIQIFGKLHALEQPHLEDPRCIKDIFKFRRSQALFASL